MCGARGAATTRRGRPMGWGERGGGQTKRAPDGRGERSGDYKKRAADGVGREGRRPNKEGGRRSGARGAAAKQRGRPTERGKRTAAKQRGRPMGGARGAHLTPHTSHVARHRSHVTRRTSHVTRHTHVSLHVADHVLLTLSVSLARSNSFKVLNGLVHLHLLQQRFKLRYAVTQGEYLIIVVALASQFLAQLGLEIGQLLLRLQESGSSCR